MHTCCQCLIANCCISQSALNSNDWLILQFVRHLKNEKKKIYLPPHLIRLSDFKSKRKANWNFKPDTVSVWSTKDAEIVGFVIIFFCIFYSTRFDFIASRKRTFSDRQKMGKKTFVIFCAKITFYCTFLIGHWAFESYQVRLSNHFLNKNSQKLVFFGCEARLKTFGFVHHKKYLFKVVLKYCSTNLKTC